MIARTYSDNRLDAMLFSIEYDRMSDTMNNVNVPANHS